VHGFLDVATAFVGSGKTSGRPVNVSFDETFANLYSPITW